MSLLASLTRNDGLLCFLALHVGVSGLCRSLVVIAINVLVIDSHHTIHITVVLNTVLQATITISENVFDNILTTVRVVVSMICLYITGCQQCSNA